MHTCPSGQQSQSPGASRQAPSSGRADPGPGRGLCFAGLLCGENANMRPPPSRGGRTGQGWAEAWEGGRQVFLTEVTLGPRSSAGVFAKLHVTLPTPPWGWPWSKTGGWDPTEASSWTGCPLLPSPIGNRGATLRRPASSPSVLPSPGLGAGGDPGNQLPSRPLDSSPRKGCPG